jgi:hypothetical protein
LHDHPNSRFSAFPEKSLDHASTLDLGHKRMTAEIASHALRIGG